MNAEQVLALAGCYQSAALARAVAQGETVDTDAERASLDSIFHIDADDTAEVFGGPAGIRLGLDAVIRLSQNPSDDLETTRIVFTMLQLERKLVRRRDLMQELAGGIGSIDRQRQHFDVLHATVASRLGELYEHTVSLLRPRIMVTGNPQLLQDPVRVARIRANLLAGIRAAVLWHQLGGRKWQLLLQRKQVVLVARGLLSRVTLEHGQ